MKSKPQAHPVRSSSDQEVATLRRALQDVLDFIEPLVVAQPDAAWQSHCPNDLIYGDGMDDAWIAGQQNGEALTAGKVLKIITAAMNPTGSS